MPKEFFNWIIFALPHFDIDWRDFSYADKIFSTIESEESVATSSGMIQACDTIRIATNNEIKRARHHCNMKRSLLINPILNKKV